MQTQEKPNQTNQPPTTQKTEIRYLNIGGIKYVTTNKTLQKFPGTYLDSVSRGKIQLIRDKDDYLFIDKCGTCFKYVLDFLRDGTLIYPPDSALKTRLIEQLKFLGLEIFVKKESVLKIVKVVENDKFVINNKYGGITTEMVKYLKELTAEARSEKKEDYKENVTKIYYAVNSKYAAMGTWNVIIHKSKDGYSLISADNQYYIYFTRYGWQYEIFVVSKK